MVYDIDMKLERVEKGKAVQWEKKYLAEKLKGYLSTTMDNVKARDQKILWIKVNGVLIWEAGNLFLPWESPALKKKDNDKPDKPRSTPLC